MKKLVFRDLKAEELEVRVGNVIKDKQTGKEKSFVPLIYKTARVDANILDETLGTFGWKNNYYQVKDTMVCSISIWDEEKQQWINKDNGGDDDFNAEKVKAELSDSMKRAGFNLGIGRKLYSLSKHSLFIELTEENTKTSKYLVKEIEYNDTEVTKIVIINKSTKKVVCESPRQYAKNNEKVSTTAQNHQQRPSGNQSIPTEELSKEVNSMESEDLKIITDYYNSLNDIKKEQFSAWLFNVVGKTEISQLNESEIKRVANAIKKVK